MKEQQDIVIYACVHSYEWYTFKLYIASYLIGTPVLILRGTPFITQLSTIYSYVTS